MAKKGEFKTHCKRGHLRTPQNVEPNSGSCKLCRRVLSKDWEINNRDKYFRKETNEY